MFKQEIPPSELELHRPKNYFHSLGTGEATKTNEFSELSSPSFSENCIAIFSRKKPA